MEYVGNASEIPNRSCGDAGVRSRECATRTHDSRIPAAETDSPKAQMTAARSGKASRNSRGTTSACQCNRNFTSKKITDHETSAHSTRAGGYAQLGKAWPARWNDHSYIWELAVRLARVDWDTPRQVLSTAVVVGPASGTAVSPPVCCLLNRSDCPCRRNSCGSKSGEAPGEPATLGHVASLRMMQ